MGGVNEIRPKVEFAPGFTWKSASPTWIDISCYVNDVRQVVSTTRGANAAHGRVDTGELTLTLNNADRRFDPLYADGPYFGQLLPGVPIRVSCYSAQGAGDDVYIDEYVDEYIGEPRVSITVPVWRGTIPAWPQRYDEANAWATVPIHGYDGFDKLSRAKIPRSVLEVELLADGPQGMWMLDETSGPQMLDSSGNGFHGTYEAGTLDDSVERDGLRGIDFDGDHYGTIADPAAVITDGSVVVEAVIAPRLGDNAGYVYVSGVGATSEAVALRVDYYPEGWQVVGTFYDGDPDNQAVSSLRGYSDTVHHVAFDRSGGAAAIYTDGVYDTVAFGTFFPAPVTVQPGIRIGNFKYSVTLQELSLVGFTAAVAAFNTDIGTGRIAAHAAAALAPLLGQRTDARIAWILNELGWPFGLRSLAGGQTALGAATFKPGDNALDYLRLCETSEDGRLFLDPAGKLTFHDRFWPFREDTAVTSQFTFTDELMPGGATYADFQLDLDDELIVNVARFARRGGTQQVVTDQASVDLHGEVEQQQTDLLQATDVEVKSLAEWVVLSRKDPQPRVPMIRIPLHAYSIENQAAVLALDLGMRVTAHRTPQGIGDQIDLDFLIDGINHQGAWGEWWVDLYVSPSPKETLSLFRWDESAWDGTDVWAY